MRRDLPLANRVKFMPADLNLSQLFLLILYLAIEVGCLIFFIVLTCLSIGAFRRTWRTALAFGLFNLLLGIPSTVAGIVYLDMSRFNAGGVQPELLPVMHAAAAVFAIMLVLLCVPIRGLYYHVASVEWGAVRGSTEEGLSGPRAARKRGILIGSATGLVALVVSLILFHFLHVRESEDVRQLEQLFPGLTALPSATRMLLAAPFVASAALIEEMIFRGGLLGFLVRMARGNRLLTWLFIALISILWAALHLSNSDHPLLKFMQIFLLGLIFGYMALRWGILSPIAAHLTLNLSAIAAAMLFPSFQ